MKRWLRIIFKVIRYGIPFVFYVLFTYPFRNKISRIKRFRKLQYYLKNLHKDLDVELHVSGLENLPNEQSFLIAPNHQSMLDGSVMFEILDDPIAFISKGEVTKVPVAKHILATMGSIFMNRDNLKEELRVMRQVRQSMLDENVKWVIYPEGTRTRDPNFKLNEFKAGTFKFPMQINKKIVPCAVFGSTRLINAKCHFKKYPIYVHFFKPFTKEDYKHMTTQDVANKCREMIQAKVDEFIQMDKKNVQKR